ncbi:MAG: hypothetical protein HQM08_01590 [Candidatus Riflebacteria bacterium]|nr:hypothetical protein [Candidatus Riflebacteria bacterium]
MGNTVVVIEHDPQIIQSADHFIELGPESGLAGGNITVEGSWEQARTNSTCLTANWMSDSAPWPNFPLHELRHPGVQIRGANLNNLKNLALNIPLGGLVVISGVSGSGKSTLLEEVLFPSARQEKPIGCSSFTVGDELRQVILVDQNLPEGSDRSLVGTLTGSLDPIKEAFAQTDGAIALNLSAAAFSPFGTAGRCETCQGSGGSHIDLDFLARVQVVCEDCSGMRFKPEILSIRYQERSISEVLEMPIDDLFTFFSDRKSIQQSLEPMRKVGLGHLSLGRTTETLSAGERQRLRLAMAIMETNSFHSGKGLSKSRKKHPPYSEKNSQERGCLFLFDEPTTGLHLADVAKLLTVFNDLLVLGHSLIVVEHHLELIKRADWVIELGPEGGTQGGYLVSEGPPL